MTESAVEKNEFHLNPSPNLLIASLGYISDQSHYKLSHIFVSDPRDILYKATRTHSKFVIHKFTDLMNSLHSLDNNTQLVTATLNGLIVFKCSQREINGFLLRIGQLELATKDFKLVNHSAYKRKLIWIPDQSRDFSVGQISAQNLFHAQLLQWRVDIDQVIEEIIEKRVVLDVEGSMGFREASGYSLVSVSDGDTVRSERKVVAVSVPLQPLYRIILQPSDPFLIVGDPSASGNDLTEAGECRDGLMCFELAGGDEIQFKFDRLKYLVIKGNDYNNYTVKKRIV